MTEETPTNEEKEAAAELIRRSRWMHNTWRGRYMHLVLKLLVLLEGLIWSIMDMARAARTKWAAKMHNE